MLTSSTIITILWFFSLGWLNDKIMGVLRSVWGQNIPGLSESQETLSIIQTQNRTIQFFTLIEAEKTGMSYLKKI